MATATLTLDGETHELPTVVGTENEVGIDTTSLRAKTGAVMLDPGYGNTGSCESAITYINGEQGILRYRGYPIEELARQASFLEVCHLLIYGALPTAEQLERFDYELKHHSLVHEDLKSFFNGYPSGADPMGVTAAMTSSLSAYYMEAETEKDENLNIVRLLAKLKTMAAFSYKRSIGQPYIYPRNDLSFAGDFLHMMFAVPSEPYHVLPVLEETFDLLLVLHADHEQNCSAATVRMVGSSGASLFSSVAAGISALSGPLHGGANQKVLHMFEEIYHSGNGTAAFIERAKNKDDDYRLYGFGHRVYKNFDPRAEIIKEATDRVLGELGLDDPLLDIAKELEETVLEDEYFTERKLYPNVDFYSGILYRAMGIPTSMFTVMFALGRLPGWIAQWREMRNDPATRIYRPRQVYVGPAKRSYVPIKERG